MVLTKFESKEKLNKIVNEIIRYELSGRRLELSNRSKKCLDQSKFKYLKVYDQLNDIPVDNGFYENSIDAQCFLLYDKM